jgi:3-dehydroquinate synthetase
MHSDKKNRGGETRCVLLQSPGEPVIDVVISDNEIRDTVLSVGKGNVCNY